jgi:hypothetical protein
MQDSKHMMTPQQTITDTDYQIYRDYWENNRNLFSTLANSLERKLVELEKQSYQFDDTYREIESALTTLSSLYSKFGSSLVNEFLLRMRSHVRDHRTEIGKQKIAFNIIHFLYEKIRSFENERFSSFPSIEGLSEDAPQETIIRPIHHDENAPFKWISFRRNNSWFLSYYKTLDIVPYRIVPFVPNTGGLDNIIEYNNSKYIVEDILSSSAANPPVDPLYYIIINDTTVRCFAADKKGRRFLSTHDFINKKIEPFHSRINQAKGFVTLAGIRHIYL